MKMWEVLKLNMLQDLCGFGCHGPRHVAFQRTFFLHRGHREDKEVRPGEQYILAGGKPNTFGQWFFVADFAVLHG